MCVLGAKPPLEVKPVARIFGIHQKGALMARGLRCRCIPDEQGHQPYCREDRRDAWCDAETLRLMLAEHDRLNHGRGMTDCEWVVKNSASPSAVESCRVAIAARRAMTNR